MDYRITRDTRRNRIYFTAPPGLLVPDARRDADGDWFGRADEPTGGLAGYLDRLVAQHEAEATSLATYQTALGIIPADYGQRHGATLGGEWSIGSDRGKEPSIASAKPKLIWEQIAQHITHYSESRGSSIAGRVASARVLHRADTAYGPVYREEFRDFDDYRTTLWMPSAMFEEHLRAEVQRLGITQETAQQWLERYRGCVGTELYEFAAQDAR